MPTISGMRRRGYPPESIRDFCSRIGVAKVNSTIALELLEHCVRDHLNKTAPRYMGVLDPLKVVIENYPEGETDMMDVVNNPEDPEGGTRKVPFSREVYIERGDFMVDPPKKFFRLSPGREVRLRNAYLVTCTDYREENGEIKEVICKLDPDSRGGNAPDGRRVKSTMHWVSVGHSVDAEVRLYDKLFSVEDPLGEKEDFKEYVDPKSLRVLDNCKVEPAVKDLGIGDRFQFLRLGYFCIDPDTSGDDIVINRTVELRDTWAKIKKQMKNRKKRK